MNNIRETENYINLKNAFKAESFSHAYLFSGEKRTGKRELAYEMAKLLLCRDGESSVENDSRMILESSHPDILVFSDTETLKIEDARKIKDFACLKPFRAEHKVIIIENAERMTREAANSLLKALEEPDGNTIFLLTTTEAGNILTTIKSRCQIINFRSNNIEDLRNSSDKENESFSEFIKNVFSENMHYAEKFSYADTLAKDEDLQEMVDGVTLLFRDILLAKTSVSDKIINQKYIEEISIQKDKMSVKKILNILETLKGIRESLGKGINTKIQLENLFLKI